MFAPLSRVPFGVFGSSQLLYFDKDSQTTCKRFQARRRWKPRCLTAVSNTTSGGGGKEPNPAFLTSLSPRKYWRLGTAVPEVIGVGVQEGERGRREEGMEQHRNGAGLHWLLVEKCGRRVLLEKVMLAKQRCPSSTCLLS